MIAAFHRPQALDRLLNLLRHPDIEIVVVNIEDDPRVAQVAGPHALPLQGNPGYAAAINAGAAVATARVIVYMNDDLEIDASNVLRLAGPVIDGSADVALPRVLDHNGDWEPTIAALLTPLSLAKEWFLLPDYPNLLARWVRGVEKWREPAGPEQIDAGSATVVATTAELMRQIPLPERYFLYCEESEWFWLLREQGSTVLYDPRAVACHTGGRDDVRPAKSRLLARNSVRCVRKTQGRGMAALAWPVVIAWNARLVAVDLVRSWLGSGPAAKRLPARLDGLRAAVGAWREV